MQLGVGNHEVLHHPRQLGGRQAGKHGARESLDGARLRQEPVHQSHIAAQFVTDDRRAQGDGVDVGRHLANVLRLAVKVLGIGGIRFQVHPFAAIEHAVGADVDQAGRRQRAQARQPVRQHGVHRQRRQGILGIGKLLDQTDTVDDHVRLDPGHYRHEGIIIQHVDAGQQIIAMALIEMAQASRTAQRPVRLECRIVAEARKNRATQHARYP